jgi:hypothetical protein
MVTYVQTAPTTDCYQQLYYYPAYTGWAYPPVSLSLNWLWGVGGGYGGWHHGKVSPSPF